MYVCMYVRMYVCIYVCVYVCSWALFVCLFVCVNVCEYSICLFVSAYIVTSQFNKNVRVFEHESLIQHIHKKIKKKQRKEMKYPTVPISYTQPIYNIVQANLLLTSFIISFVFGLLVGSFVNNQSMRSFIAFDTLSEVKSFTI